MGIDDLPLEEKIKRARNKLNRLRAGVRELLGKDSLRSEELDGVMTDYVLFLHTMPFVCYKNNKSDIRVDLEIAKDMGRKCKAESDKAKIKYFELQFAFIFALRKKAMMQLKLEGILKEPDGIPDELDTDGSPDELDPDRSPDELDPDRSLYEFRNECSGLHEVMCWDRIIKDTIQMEEETNTQAGEKGANVDHLIKTVEPDPIDVNDPDQVKQQFTSYSYELIKVSREMDENLSMRAKAPEMCKSAENLVGVLEDYCSYCDEIKVDKASQDVHCSIQPEDGGRESRDVHCSMHSKEDGRDLSYDEEERDEKKEKEKMAAQVQVIQPQPPLSEPNGAGNTGQFQSTSLYVGDLEVNVTDSQLHEMAAKVIGMLLEMDQNLGSHEALKAKVAEAKEVLRNVQQQQQLASSSADNLASE